MLNLQGKHWARSVMIKLQMVEADVVFPLWIPYTL